MLQIIIGYFSYDCLYVVIRKKTKCNKLKRCLCSISYQLYIVAREETKRNKFQEVPILDPSSTPITHFQQVWKDFLGTQAIARITCHLSLTSSIYSFLIIVRFLVGSISIFLPGPLLYLNGRSHFLFYLIIFEIKFIKVCQSNLYISHFCLNSIKIFVYGSGGRPLTFPCSQFKNIYIQPWGPASYIFLLVILKYLYPALETGFIFDFIKQI